MTYSASELKYHAQLRARIARLRKGMSRRVFQARNADTRNLIAQRFATRIMELQLQLPSAYAELPGVLNLEAGNFVPVKRLNASTVLYRRGTNLESVSVERLFRPDITNQFAYLFK